MKIGNLYHLLLILALIVFVCSFLLVRQTFDIRIFDTFYVLRLKNLYWWLAGALILCRLFYHYKPLPLFSAKLIRIHVILTLIAGLLIPLYHLYTRQLASKSGSINLYDVPLFHRNNFGLTILLFVLGAAQIPVAINVMWGYYDEFKNGVRQ